MTNVTPETTITDEETSKNGECKTYYTTSVFEIRPIERSEKDAEALKTNNLVFKPIALALDKSGNQIGRAELKTDDNYDIKPVKIFNKNATYHIVGTSTFCNDTLEGENKIEDIYSLQINFS
nr:hypothetical protein [Carnobacterium maltaromaticum]